jgi:lysophospholipase L1-like esterase
VRVFLRRAAAGLGVTAVILGVLEGGARLYEIGHPPRAIDVGLGFDPASRVFAPAAGEPGFYLTTVEKRVAFRERRFAVPKRAGTLRLFAVGESSVYGLDDELQTMALRMSQRLGRPVEIIDAGGRSYGSQRLVPIARELLDYQPDGILLYLGHNEFEELEQLELASPRLAPLTRAAMHLALFRVPLDAIVTAREKTMSAHNRQLLAIERPDYTRAWSHRFTEAEVEQRMRAFDQHVRDMLELWTARGIPVVMGTIPSNRFRPKLRDGFPDELRDLQARGEWEKADERARALLANATWRHQSSDRENAILRAVAASYRVPIAEVERAVVDAEPHHVPGETLFVDHCHLNQAGKAIWARLYLAELDRIF